MTRCKRGRPRMSVVVPVNCVNKQKSIHQEKKGKKEPIKGGKKKVPIKKSVPDNSVCKQTYLHTRSRDNVNAHVIMLFFLFFYSLFFLFFYSLFFLFFYSLFFSRSHDNVILLCMCTCASRYTRTTSHTSHA